MERVERTINEFNEMSRDFLASLKYIYGNRPAVVEYLDKEMADLQAATTNAITRVIPIQRYCELLNQAWYRKPGTSTIYMSLEAARKGLDDPTLPVERLQELDMGQEILNLFATPAHEQRMKELDLLPDSDEKTRLMTGVVAEMLHNTPKLGQEDVQALLFAGKELFSKCKGLDPVRQYMKWLPDQRLAVVRSVFMLTAICKAWEQTHGNETAAAKMAQVATSAQKAFAAYQKIREKDTPIE